MLKKIYTFNQDITFSPSLFRLTKGEKSIKLSNREAELLNLLCDDAGKVLNRGTLMELLWPHLDSADANLNRVILSLRRKFESFGVMDAIDTVPRVGYLFKLPLEICYQDECYEALVDESMELSNQELLVEQKHKFKNLNSKWSYVALLCLPLFIGMFYWVYQTTSSSALQVMDLSLRNISLYMTKEAELVHKKPIGRLAKILEEKGLQQSGKVSILIGRKAISFFLIDHERKFLSANVFMLRSGRNVIDELKCVIETVNNGNVNVTGNYYDAINSTIRFHKDCMATGGWIETRHRSHLLVNGDNDQLVVTSLTASDANHKKVFRSEMVGNVQIVDDDEFDINIDINSSSVSDIDQHALLENSLVSTLIGAFRAPRQKEHYIHIPGGLYVSSYLDGILIWPAKESLKIVRY